MYGPTSAGDLLTAVEAFLRNDLLAAVDGRVQFHVRVAANALAIVRRELELAPRHEKAHQRRLSDLGMTDDAELACAIRAGAFDDRMSALLTTLSADVADKLAVSNPKYVDTEPVDDGCTANTEVD